MPRGFGNSMTLSFPPFTKAVKWLVIINAGIFFGLLLLQVVARPVANEISIYGALIPAAVLHGYVYQVVTYAFLHGSIMHILGNMLVLWMFGSQIEMDFGTRQFLEFYFWCMIGAALTTIGVSYTHLFGVTPMTPTIGASGAIFGIYAAFAMLHGESEIMLFPLPIQMKAKYFVWILILVTLALSLSAASGSTGASIAYACHLGGLLFGYIYLKFLPRRGLRFFASERYYGVRNSYYRWKRRRAARKFEVYMRQHKREDYFDEYGNFKDPKARPDDKDNGHSSGSGWVN
jgi:membrane associated rhomboid family serine protease